MPVAICSESGAADPLLTLPAVLQTGLGHGTAPLLACVGRGVAFQHWWALLLPDWEWLMPRACASFNCLMLHTCGGG